MRSRFVSPETVRIDLTDGDWIEVKRVLGKGDDTKFRSAGLGRMVFADGGKREMDVDYVSMSFARVDAYLVDWSFKGHDGKKVDISTQAKRRAALDDINPEDFDEIDRAIQDHIGALEAEKKARSGNSNSTSESA